MSKKSINHISIIMDGNGRWANMRNMPRAFGHREGIKSIDKIVKACSVRQITQLTLFAFSSENWNRPDYEVRVLLKLFEDSINKYLIDLNKNNVKLNFIINPYEKLFLYCICSGKYCSCCFWWKTNTTSFN